MQDEQAMDQAMKHQVQKQGRVMKVDQDIKRSHDVWILSQVIITHKRTSMMGHVHYLQLNHNDHDVQIEMQLTMIQIGKLTEKIEMLVIIIDSIYPT